MIRKRRYWATCWVNLAILLLTALSGVAADTSNQTNTPQFEILQQPLDLYRPSYRPVEAASCSLKNHVPTAMAYYSGIQAGYRFASYMNPANCIGSLDYPYSIYFVSFPLLHFTGARWPLGIQLQVWSANPGDSCAGPQELLHSRHYLLDSASFMAPKVGVIQLVDPVCVDGAFYISIEYDGTTPLPYPSVLFDTIVPPVNCLNWGYRDNAWHEWTDFWTGPIAGNFIVWVDGYSNSNYCATDEDTVRTIEGIHQQLDSLNSRRVSVVGYYTDSAEAKLVSFHPDYLENSPMPPRTEAFVIGPQPHDSFAGSLVMATGYLQRRNDPAPISPLDDDELLLYAPRWEKIVDAPSYPSTSGDSTVFWPDPDICQSRKVALLMGSGPNESNNHRRYWGELTMAYNTLSVPYNYCPDKVFVMYADGISENTASIPQSAMRWYTKSAVDSALAAIARGSANAVRLGQPGWQLNLFITGQAGPTGLITRGGTVITPGDLRNWLQRALDSSVTDLTVTLTPSNAGALASALLTLDDHGVSQNSVMTASGNDAGWSSPNSSALWRTYLDTANATWYIGARAAATTSSVDFTSSLQLAWQQARNDYRAWLLAHPNGTVDDTIRTKIIADTSSLNNRIAEIAATLSTPDSRPWLWERGHHQNYGYWRAFVLPENGQATITFTGDTSTSGSVTVYEDSVYPGGFTANKRAVWNWNIPGSSGYTSGNSIRTINGVTSDKSTLWMHCDDPGFTYTARLRTDQPNAVSTSNPYDLAGFSVAGQAQGREFMNLIPSLFDTASSVELPGLILKTASSQWGSCGSSEMVSQFSVPSLTSWHAEMEVRIAVHQVVTPGTIDISIPGATNPAGSLSVTSPGIFRFNCGAFTGTGPQELKFSVTTGCFVVDAYSLRSKVLDPPSCCIGTTGNINGVGSIDLSDLSLMIGYLIGGFAAPTCYDEGDINISGRIDLTDLSLLIAYLVSGGVTFPNCP